MLNHLPPKIMQFSFVVNDLDTAILHWAEKLNVGPFFVLEHVPYTTCLYRGEASEIDMSVAMAYNGDTQIELVQQHNDAPSIFNDFITQRGQGLQHVAAISDDLESDLQHYRNLGVEPVQQGEAENGTVFAYLDTDFLPGTMLELVSLPNEVLSAFTFMQNKAAEWQTGDPARYR